MAQELTYAQKCGIASKETGVPFEVCLAITPDFAEEYARQYEYLKTHTARVGDPPTITLNALQGINAFHNPLKVDLYTMKETIIALLDPSNDLRKHIEESGIKNCTRISNHLLEIWR